MNQPTNEVEFAAMGDMIPHGAVSSLAINHGTVFDYTKFIDPDIKKAFSKADLRFCNQEAPAARSFSVAGYPHFNANPSFIDALCDMGANLINLATNHTYDRGLQGVIETLEKWDTKKSSIYAIAGANRDYTEQNALRLFEINGIKFGYTAFTEASNLPVPSSFTLNLLENETLLTKQLKQLRANCDVLIISVHWICEDRHSINEFQRKTIHKLAHLNVDIVIGTGPHYLQPYDIIESQQNKKMHVWYSIGNGLNMQLKTDQLIGGIAMLNIKKTKNRIIIDNARLLPTYNHYDWDINIGNKKEENLLKRYNLQFRLLHNSDHLLSNRKDFQTSEDKQIDVIKRHIGNKVTIIKKY